MPSEQSVRDSTKERVEIVAEEVVRMKGFLAEQSRVVQGFVNAQVSNFSDLSRDEFDRLVENGRRAASDLKRSFQNTFLDAMRGEFKDFGDFLEGVFRSVLASIQQQIARSLVERSFIGNLIGGLQGNISGLLGSFFGGGPAGAAPTPAGASGTVPFFRAGDTPGVQQIPSSGALFGFKGGDKVAAAQKIKDLRNQVNGAGSGGAGNTTVININAIDAKSFEQRLAQSNSTINGIVSKNIGDNGSVRDQLREFL